MKKLASLATTDAYQRAMRFWYGRVNYEQTSPTPADLKLDRMRALLRLLGDPHERLRIVHIAGSKGKGSTSAMLAAILQRAGYRTGLFTSPHLVEVEERFQVNGQPIAREVLAGLLDEVREVSESAGADFEESLSFFEIATAVGFLHFVRRRVDVAVLEVGLGGRFDSTNVCRPLVALVTSISFDHTQQLGKTLAKIAMEKAGIIKPGRPAISGVREPEAKAVIETICRQRGASLVQLGVNFRYEYEPAAIGRNGDEPARVRVVTQERGWPTMRLALAGAHQAANAAVVVATVEELCRQGLAIPEHAVAAGLAQVQWPARLEVVGHKPLVLLDCAHNVASVQALVETLATSLPASARGKRWLVFASSRDKDVAGMLEVLAAHFDHIYFTRFPDNPRALSPEAQAEKLRAGRASYSVAQEATEAWEQARRQAGPDDVICITGSVFLAGALRPLLLRGRDDCNSAGCH